MNRKFNTSHVLAALRRIAVSAAALALVFVVPAGALGQRNAGRQGAPRAQSRPAQPRQQPQIRQNQNQQRQYENRTMPTRPAYQPERQMPNTARPATGAQVQRGNSNQQAAPRQPYQGARPERPNTQTVRPALPGPPPSSATSPGAAATPGHLGSWLNQHSNLPLQGQQQLLRSDPSFKRLPQADQQRLMRQLQEVNNLPAQERQRRLARAETIERMSPQERIHLNQATRQLSTLPSDRQSVVRRAFRDLRGVPLDQRTMVLNSQRYQGQFTPEERGILGNLLRAEPYQPQP